MLVRLDLSNGKVIVLYIMITKENFMKRIFFGAGVVIALVSCGNATDGDASTDTTSMPIDTAATSGAIMDPGASINRNTGSYPQDSASRTDVRSSSPSNPGSRSTTVGSEKQDSSRLNGGRRKGGGGQ